MKKTKLLTAAVTIVFVFSLGCKKEGPNNLSSSEEISRISTTQSTTLSPAMQQELEALYAKIPENAKAKVSGQAKIKLEFHPQYRDIIRKTLKLEESTCNDNTASSQWLDQQLADWNNTIINRVLNAAMLDLPTYDALIFENSSAGHEFGSD